MMDTMKYKGFEGTIRYSNDDECLIGEVIDMSGTVGYDGTSVDEITAAFHEAVDDYLAYCAEENIEPAKTYSGNYALRMTPELHKAVALAATREGLSLKDWIVAAMETMIEAGSRFEAAKSMVDGGMTPSDVLEISSAGNAAVVREQIEQAREQMSSQFDSLLRVVDHIESEAKADMQAPA